LGERERRTTEKISDPSFEKVRIVPGHADEILEPPEVVAVVQVRDQELQDAVLVGHSYGGRVVTGAADRTHADDADRTPGEPRAVQLREPPLKAAAADLAVTFQHAAC